MSDGTEILVSHDIREGADIMERLRRPLPDQPALRPLEWDGVQPVWHAMLGRIDLNDVIGHLALVPWRFPENVQVFVKKEQDERFQVWAYTGPTLGQLIDGNPES